MIVLGRMGGMDGSILLGLSKDFFFRARSMPTHSHPSAAHTLTPLTLNMGTHGFIKGVNKGIRFCLPFRMVECAGMDFALALPAPGILHHSQN